MLVMSVLELEFSFLYILLSGYYIADKSLYSQSYGFYSGHV